MWFLMALSRGTLMLTFKTGDFDIKYDKMELDERIWEFLSSPDENEL